MMFAAAMALALVFAAASPAPLVSHAGQPEPGQPASPAAPASAPRQPLAEKYAESLAALSPDNPEAYFLLGETIAAELHTLADRALARELFVLAYELGRRPGQRSTLSASCCLALASLPGEERRGDWLRSIAALLDDRFASPEWLLQRSPESQDSAEFLVATVIGLVRSGDGALARQLLSRDDVKAAVRRYDTFMRRYGISGGAWWVEREAEKWPCRECGNQRIVRRIMTNPPEYKLCPNCNGNPGPRLAYQELIDQVRFESILLQGRTRSWGGQVSLDSGEPLLDPDPALLPRLYLVDTRRTVWRDGQWTLPASAASATPAPTQAPPPGPADGPAQTPAPADSQAGG